MDQIMNDPMTHTKLTLDLAAAAGCQVPGCSHDHDKEIFIHPRCHPGAGLSASYKQGSGVLRLSCRRCDRFIVDVAVEKPALP